MPRLLAILPCEKAITDQEDRSVTVVAIMESLRVRLFAPLPSTSGDLPAPPVEVPYRWFVVCLWSRQVVDEEFEQHITLTAPSGKTPLDTPATLIKMTKRSHRVIIKVDGMPLDEDGEHTLAVYWRPLNSEVWMKAGEFPILLEKTIVPPGEEEA
jgi:hypothetical protein